MSGPRRKTAVAALFMLFIAALVAAGCRDAAPATERRTNPDSDEEDQSRRPGESVESYLRRISEPTISFEKALSRAKQTARPHRLEITDSDLEAEIPRDEDWFSIEECRARAEADGRDKWHFKNHYSACNVLVLGIPFCKNGIPDPCIREGYVQVRLTMLGYGHRDTRGFDWAIHMDQWDWTGQTNRNTPYTFAIACSPSKNDGSQCTTSWPVGETRPLSEWETLGQFHQTTDTSTPATQDNPYQVGGFIHRPRASSLIQSTDLGELPGRCDDFKYPNQTQRAACTFPQTTGILTYDATKDETRESVLFFHQAMHHLSTLRENSENRYVPGGYYKQPLTDKFEPLHRRYPADGSRYKVQRECQRLYPNYTDDSKQCDEYPFHSTKESAYASDGSKQATWAVKAVNGSHNETTGRMLDRFYDDDHIIPDDEFFVHIENAPSACEGCNIVFPMPADPVEPASTSKLGGSFIQPDLIDGWTDQQLHSELQEMKGMQMSTLVLQWTANSYDKREGRTKTAIYPTGLAGFRQTTHSDIVERTLTAADQEGAKVWLGLQVNDAWWDVYAHDGGWLDTEKGIAIALAKDLWARYGSHRSIAGWYLSFELDNVNFSDADSQTRMIAFYRDVIGALKRIGPRALPVAVAPFFNAVNTALPGWQNPDAFERMWKNVLEQTNIDVVALQDGIGAGHGTPGTIAPWFAAMRRAVNGAESRAWLISDTETFFIGASGLMPMTSRDIVAGIYAVHPYVEGYWSFSYNHYQSYRSKFGSYPHYNAYRMWQQYGTGDGTDGLAPSTPGWLSASAISPQTVLLSWQESTDGESGVGGYHLYRNGELVADKLSANGAFTDRQLDGSQTYRYEVRAFDGSGLESNLSPSKATTTDAMPAAPVNYARCGARDGEPGCPYTTQGALADPRYPDNGRELTDGKHGPELFDDTWQGRNAPGKYSFIIDLGADKTIQEINSRWFQVREYYAFLPPNVTYSIATAQAPNDFRIVESIDIPAVSARMQAKTYRTIQSRSGRYVKVEVDGGTAWTLVDEVEVRGL